MSRDANKLLTRYLAAMFIMLSAGVAVIVRNTYVFGITTERVGVIEDLYLRTSDRWTMTDQRVWCGELQRANRNITVPECVHQGVEK